MFPWDRERDVSRPFRGNPNSKQGVAHRICVAREKKKQNEALGRYVKESQMSKIHAEQDRRVGYARSKNQILQRAGEHALVKEEEELKQRLRERSYARQDELLAQELAKRKNEEESRRREIQQICERDEGLRELQRKLKSAYVNKERVFQLETKARNISMTKEEESKMDAMLERERVAALAAQRAKEEKRREIRKRQAQINNQQIDIKNAIEREDAYNEFIRDKQAVESLMQDIAKEIRQEELAKIKKKNRFKQEMNDALEMRKQDLERRKQEEKAHDIACAEYRQTQGLRKAKAEAKAKAAAERAAKIFNKLKEDAERQYAEEERVRSAIALLRKEEADRRRDEKARLKREKEEKSLREMMAANEAQKRHKVELRAKAMEEEQRLVKIMLDKFERDTQKEKMEQLQRRQAKLRFKMNILDQLEEKRKRYEEMRQREEDSLQAEEKERTYKAQVVEEARRRLLMEHAAALKGFLPKGVIQKLEDMDVFEMRKVADLSLDAARESMRDYGDLRNDEDRVEPDAFKNYSERSSPRRVDFSSRGGGAKNGGQEEEEIPVHLRSTRPW